jgi:hypothetical protein
VSSGAHLATGLGAAECAGAVAGGRDADAVGPDADADTNTRRSHSHSDSHTVSDSYAFWPDGYSEPDADPDPDASGRLLAGVGSEQGVLWWGSGQL